MKYRILHLITHLGVGGAQDYALQIVQQLDRSQYEVHVAAGEDETEWSERARAYSDKLHSVSHLKRDIEPRHDIAAIGEIVRLLKREQYHVVHTHSSKAGALGRIAARIAGVPVVVHTVHGFAWNDYMAPHTRALYEWIERGAGLLSDRVLTVCEANARDLVQKRIVAADKITTVYNGINTAHLAVAVDRRQACADIGLDPDHAVVGCVGRLSEQKAPLDFVAAAREVVQQMPNVQFVWVGDGPLRPQFEAAIADLPQVRLLGSRADIPVLLQLFDVFVSSSWWEGLSRAVTEALLVKLPVVATDVGGTSEIVINNDTGLLVLPQQPQEIAHSIIQLLQDRAFAARLGARGYDLVRHQFSTTTMVKRLDMLYLELLNARLGQFTFNKGHLPR